MTGARPIDAEVRAQEAEKRAAELHASVQQLHDAILGSEVTLWSLEVSPSGVLEDGHDEMKELWDNLGYESPLASLGQSGSIELVHPYDRSTFEDVLRACIAGERDEVRTELRVRHRQGHESWVLVRGAAIRDDAGRTVRLVGTVIDISELKTVERELREAKQAAETANLSKDEFLANVSHEIRTPMNAILGMTELVLDTPLADHQRRSLLTVCSAGHGLLEIINELLDFSEIQAGQIALEEAPFALRAAIAETMRALGPRAQRKGLELLYEVAADVPDALLGDVARVRQVVVNLVGNAIKFTERGEVAVSFKLAETGPDDGRVSLQLSVRDTGIGISQAKFGAVFRAFEQEDMSTTRRYGGTGLGLTIAARLIRMMQGTISLDSKVGEGSDFVCTMTFVRGPVSESGRPALAATLRGVRALLVDDNASTRHLLDSWLRAAELVPTAVSDGIAALDLLWDAVASGTPYPLVLIDARMPGIDGLTLTARIRERTELADSRIIVLTEGSRPCESERFRELGVETLVLKPVVREELLDTIEEVMRSPNSTTRSSLEGDHG